MERRSTLEIFAEILTIAGKGARKTRIVYGANLNFKMLGEYLEKLEKADLIKNTNDNKGIIQTTPKGKEYLDQFSTLKQFSPELYS